jgi:hypothetical protein
MKSKKILIVILCMVAGINLNTLAQNQVLKEIFKDKMTYAEIAGAFETYIDTAPDSYQKERNMKHFNRWAYFASMHLGPDGNFVNISEKNMEAAKSRLELSPDRSYNGNWTFVGPYSTYLNHSIMAYPMSRSLTWLSIQVLIN